MIARRRLVLATCTAALALTACSSAVSGQGSVAGPAAGPSTNGTGTGTSSPAPASSGAATSETLASRLQTGVLGVQYAHFALHVTAGGLTIDGQGDEQLSKGKTVALDLTETVPGVGSLQIIQVAGKTYLKLPQQLNPSGKPYLLVTANSTNPVAQQLAGSLASTQSTASLDSAAIFATAARSVQDLGPTTAGGVPVTHYRVVVDIAKLPDGYPGKSQLQGAALPTLPVELYIDAESRPVEVTETLSVAGTSTSSRITVSRYNQPVTITAPPASQVSTD